MTDAAVLEWVRRGQEQQARKEAERLAILATQPSREENSMTDRPVINPDDPAPASMPIDEWMAHERARKVSREKARLEVEAIVPRDGNIGVKGLMRGTRGAYRY